MMSMFKGFASNCMWTYMTGEPFSQEVWDRRLQTAFDSSQPLTEKATLLTIGWQSAAPPARARQQLAARLASSEQYLRAIAGSAMVFDSKIARGTLTAINWIARKPYPEKVFGHLDEALAWLSRLTPAFAAPIVWRSIIDTVPRELLRIHYSGR